MSAVRGKLGEPPYSLRNKSVQLLGRPARMEQSTMVALLQSVDADHRAGR
jgi:hypothetical protein